MNVAIHMTWYLIKGITKQKCHTWLRLKSGQSLSLDVTSGDTIKIKGNRGRH